MSAYHPESLFIVFEGIDGAGTTTQTQLLFEEMRRRRPHQEIIKTREPYDANVTRRIRTWLAEEDPPYSALLHAFILDRHIHMRERVIPALKRGAIVISDRFKWSTLVYQPRHNPVDLVSRLTHCPSIPDPDMYVFLDVDPDVAAGRLAKRSVPKDAYERNVQLQREVAVAYRGVAERSNIPKIVLEATDMSIMEVAVAVEEAVCGALEIT